jgi:uncharacterized membrane protein
MTQKRNVRLIVLSAICLVYVLPRLWNLTETCLWFDEIFSVHAAEMDWGNLFRFIAQDLIHPPFFYVLLKIWMALGGESLLWLRLFPVFFSTAALLPFYFLCRELKLNLQTVAIAFFLFAVNGGLIKYAQEVRMYSVLLFLSLTSLWLFFRYFKLGKNIWILTLINLLLIYTHYFGWLVVAAEIVAIAALQRIKIGQTLAMLGILLAGFSPWIFAVWRAAQVNSNVGQNIGWISKPNIAAVLQFGFDLIEPFYFQATSIDYSSNYLISVPFLLIFIAAAVFWLTDWKNKSADEKQNFILLLILIKIPVMAALTASWIAPYSVWGARHLISVFAPASILLAIFLAEIKISAVKNIFITGIVSLSLIAFIVQIRSPEPKFIWCAWENLAQNIDKNRAAKIYVFEDLVAYHLWFAARDSDKMQIVKIREFPDLIEDKAYFLPRGFNGVETADPAEISGEKFYIAFRDTAWDENRQPLKFLIEKGYKIGTPETYEANGLEAFLVEVTR